MQKMGKLQPFLAVPFNVASFMPPAYINGSLSLVLFCSVYIQYEVASSRLIRPFVAHFLYSLIFHRWWTCNQFQTLLDFIPMTLSYQVPSNWGILWRQLWRVCDIFFWQWATSALPLSTHQGQKQNMVGHHVLHYLTMWEEDTPREECNFKLEKND